MPATLLHLQPSFSSREPAGRTMVSILTRIHELIDAAFFYISHVQYIASSPSPTGTLSPWLTNESLLTRSCFRHTPWLYTAPWTWWISSCMFSSRPRLGQLRPRTVG
jgi:hypothetical protein